MIRAENMVSDKAIDKFVESLKDDGRLPNIQNPWNDSQNVENLKEFLKLRKSAKYILVGEAPGRKGCLQCGVPFCDDYTIEKILGKDLGKKKKLKETSAQRIYAVFGNNFIAWNAFPYQPCKSPTDKTNRTPSSDEIQYGLSKLKEFLQLFGGDKTIFLLGSKALDAWQKLVDKEQNQSFLKNQCIKLLHPSSQADRYRKKGGMDGWKEYINEQLKELSKKNSRILQKI